MGTVIEAVGVATGRRRSSARRLADTAAARALAGACLDAADVDLLLNAGLYHDRILGEPALAALIQEDIGANPGDPHAGGHGTFSFDVANGSCGMLTALQVADGFLRAGSARHALVVASDADPGHHLAPGFPFAPVGAALTCGWRPGDEGLAGFRFSAEPAPGVGGPDGGLHATVGARMGRNRLAIDVGPSFLGDAAALAADVAAKLLADLGLAPGDVDAVVANPLDPAFLDPLGERLGLRPSRRAGAPRRGRVHTAALGVALAPVLAAPHPRPYTLLLISAGAGPVAGAALLRQ